jgi:hypothetical protein
MAELSGVMRFDLVGERMQGAVQLCLDRTRTGVRDPAGLPLSELRR